MDIFYQTGITNSSFEIGLKWNISSTHWNVIKKKLSRYLSSLSHPSPRQENDVNSVGDIEAVEDPPLSLESATSLDSDLQVCSSIFSIVKFKNSTYIVVQPADGNTSLMCMPKEMEKNTFSQQT